MKIGKYFVLILIIAGGFFSSNIKDRFLEEFKVNSSFKEARTISVKEAWYKEQFSPNDYFSGSAFRVYQTRLFFEFLKEEPIFWKGLGLNASYPKLEEKAKKYNVFLGSNQSQGYQNKNFHNQYIQIFAEIGIIGFFLLLVILFLNVKNAFIKKDFMHIAFSILIISVFLTESFLWRQRGVVFFSIFYCLFNTIPFPSSNNRKL